MIAVASSSRTPDGARVLKLECPASGASAGPDRQQRDPKGARADDCTSRVRQRVAPGVPLVAAALREVQGLQGQDRENAGHEVEEEPAEERSPNRPQQAIHARITDGSAAFGNVAADRAELEPAALAIRQHAIEAGRLARPTRDFGNQLVIEPRKLCLPA